MKFHAGLCTIVLLAVALSCDAFFLKNGGGHKSSNLEGNGHGSGKGGFDFQAILGRLIGAVTSGLNKHIERAQKHIQKLSNFGGGGSFNLHALLGINRKGGPSHKGNGGGDRDLDLSHGSDLPAAGLSSGPDRGYHESGGDRGSFGGDGVGGGDGGGADVGHQGGSSFVDSGSSFDGGNHVGNEGSFGGGNDGGSFGGGNDGASFGGGNDGGSFGGGGDAGGNHGGGDSFRY